MKGLYLHFVMILLFVLGACAPTDKAEQGGSTALGGAIVGLGPDVDPIEAERAARIAFRHTDELSRAYEITDPPLVHNTKVNMGLKPRGLCWHWAEDMEKRLNEEDFATLRIHRAIANADNPLRIDHSTAIISARGADMTEGIVLDPWRYGGKLFWAPLQEDTRYNWVPRTKVLAAKYETGSIGDVR